MCGLAGFHGRGTAADLRAMTARLVHRGPDDEAYAVDGAARVFLGFRRLVVIDAATGGQPMRSAAHGLTVVFNGEIYNHAALRRELEAAGHRFLSDHSDTEVLLHGYAAWGAGLPEHLDGMFAFAIWDARHRRIFCARDRFGEKPFYYAAVDGLFAFASELTALHAHSGLADAIDPAGVQKFFGYGYVPAPGTMYRLARKLEPGGTLIYETATGVLRAGRYWRFAIEAGQDAPARRIPALAEELRWLLGNAVRRRAQADVPLGVFLSGGLDSTAILAFAMAQGDRAMKSFTLGFAAASYDESAFAARAADALGSRHYERRVDLAAARAALPGLLAGLDEPFADPSVLPTHLLSRFARGQVTVALSGDGGDELFAGYDPFAALRPGAAYRRVVPAGLHRLLRAAAGRLPRDDRNMSLQFRVRRLLGGLSHRPALWNPAWLGPLAAEEFAACFDDPLPAEALYAEAIAAWEGSEAGNDVDRTLEFYSNFYLPEMILAKTDRASMRASLEVRAPFLDPDVVAFCRRLPHGYKLRRGVRKFLLKEALRGVVPDFVRRRRKKGFGIPLGEWLGALRPGAGPSVPGMNGGYAAARWQGFLQGREDERLFLWAHLCMSHAGAGL